MPPRVRDWRAPVPRRRIRGECPGTGHQPAQTGVRTSVRSTAAEVSSHEVSMPRVHSAMAAPRHQVDASGSVRAATPAGPIPSIWWPRLPESPRPNDEETIGGELASRPAAPLTRTVYAPAEARRPWRWRDGSVLPQKSVRSRTFSREYRSVSPAPRPARFGRRVRRCESGERRRRPTRDSYRR